MQSFRLSAAVAVVAVLVVAGTVSTPSSVRAEQVDVIKVIDILADVVPASPDATRRTLEKVPKSDFKLPWAVVEDAVKNRWLPLETVDGRILYVQPIYLKRERGVCDIAPSQANKQRALGTGLGAGEGC